MSEYMHTSIRSPGSSAENLLVVPPLGTKILEWFWPEDEPTTEDGDRFVGEESARCWASYDGKGYFPEMTKKENAPPFLMLSPPPGQRVSRMQLPVVVSDAPPSGEFTRQDIDFTAESQL
ncbi:hypothetical protein SCLCIDRAFT_33223 [Scleroderma citrinum Foug A]|uniref:Uncharacterized protein n=1 Tax=Scleroderma citrinum Foug A TaxID=1036808 RepID=A0A0C2YPQ6_9AGAM|nr:hypothetical protein SCLCIDRAFT_33223 [Scleroderma citrinum Foug A]